MTDMQQSTRPQLLISESMRSTSLFLREFQGHPFQMLDFVGLRNKKWEQLLWNLYFVRM